MISFLTALVNIIPLVEKLSLAIARLLKAYKSATTEKKKQRINNKIEKLVKIKGEIENEISDETQILGSAEGGDTEEQI